MRNFVKALVATILACVTLTVLTKHWNVILFTATAFGSEDTTECAITRDEFFSLIMSTTNAKDNFLRLTDTSLGQMWWGATLGLNDSLEHPLTRSELESKIRELRDTRPVHPEVSVYFRTREVFSERNAQDFFYFVSDLCEDGLIEIERGHGDRILERAHQSLNDLHSSYLNAAEAEEHRLEQLSPEPTVFQPLPVFRSYELADDVYVLEISSLLHRSIAGDVSTALETIAFRCPTPHIIIDMRNNRGGSLTISTEVVGNFLPNQTVAHLEYRDGTRVSIKTQRREHPFRFGSLTVLVNEHTASGAEIITAALSENGALTIGGKTYGKGVGQILGPLLNGGISRITHFRVYSPSGKSWHESGITPNVPVDELRLENTPDDMRAELERNLGPLILDTGIVSAYRAVSEGKRDDVGCHE